MARLLEEGAPVRFVDILVERNRDCARLIAICDQAKLRDPEARAAVDEIRAALRLRKPT